MHHLIFLLALLISNSHAFVPEIKQYVDEIPTNIECILAADIGGTKSSVGIFNIEDNKPVLLISMHTATKNIGDFNETMNNLFSYLYDSYGITIEHACIAAPGVATKNKDYSNVHGMFDIRTCDLLEKTPLKTAIIVNDLFVVGHGLDLVSQDKIIQLYGDKPEEKNKEHIRAIISAGSGIGSSTITWDSQKETLVTHPGEAGMLEFSPTNKLEYSFYNHVKNFYGRTTTYWGNIASGSGITRIYSMLKLMNIYQDTLNLDDHDPKVILQNPQDELCKATSDLFFKLFGRFARNYTWSVLPYGGLYIVGGILAQHAELFEKQFASNYEEPQFLFILREIPVYMVTDANVGLYGAASYLLIEKQQNND